MRAYAPFARGLSARTAALAANLDFDQPARRQMARHSPPEEGQPKGDLPMKVGTALNMLCEGFRPSVPVAHIARILGFVARSSEPDLQGHLLEAPPGSSRARFVGRNAPEVSVQPCSLTLCAGCSCCSSCKSALSCPQAPYQPACSSTADDSGAYAAVQLVLRQVTWTFPSSCSSPQNLFDDVPLQLWRHL